MSSLPYSPPVLVKVAPSEKRNTPSSSLRVTMHHLSLFPRLALTSTHMSSIPTQKSSTWSELRVEWRRSSTSAVLGAARRPPARGRVGRRLRHAIILRENVCGTFPIGSAGINSSQVVHLTNSLFSKHTFSTIKSKHLLDFTQLLSPVNTLVLISL